MLGGFDKNTLKLTWNDVQSRVTGDMTAMIWKETRHVHTDKYA